MTITNQECFVDYQGNGATTQFDFTFLVSEQADLNVATVRRSDGLVIVLEEGDDYTVTGLGDADGGTVTVLGTALASTHMLRIWRNTIPTQSTSVSNQQRYNASVTMRVWDRLEMQLQELKRDQRRALSVALGEEINALPALDLAGKVLGFNILSGQPEAVTDISSIEGAAAAADRAEAAAASIINVYEAGPGIRPVLSAALNMAQTNTDNIHEALDLAQSLWASTGVRQTVYVNPDYEVPIVPPIYWPNDDPANRGNLIWRGSPGTVLRPTEGNTVGFFQPADRDEQVENIEVYDLTVEAYTNPDDYEQNDQNGGFITIPGGTRPFNGSVWTGRYKNSYLARIRAPNYFDDQGMIYGVEECTVVDPYWNCVDVISGTGGHRLFEAIDSMIYNACGTSPDDCQQFCPVDAVGTPYYNLICRNSYYIGGHVVSSVGRALVIITDDNCTENIDSCGFIGVQGRGGGGQIRVLNFGNGRIVAPLFWNITLDGSNAILTPYGQRHEIRVTGDITDLIMQVTEKHIRGPFLRLEDWTSIVSPFNTGHCVRGHFYLNCPDAPELDTIPDDDAVEQPFWALELNVGTDNVFDAVIAGTQQEDAVYIGSEMVRTTFDRLHIRATPVGFQHIAQHPDARMTLVKHAVLLGNGGRWTLSGVDRKDFIYEYVTQGTSWIEDSISVDNINFVTREAFVAWDAVATPITGMVVTAAGVAYEYVGSGTAISDLPGWLPYADYTPMHWGATGDGVANDGPEFNLALAAYRTRINAIANDDGTVAFDGLGKIYKTTVSLDATAIVGWGQSFRNFTILGHCTGKCVLDMVGSRGGTLSHIVIAGDSTNRPSVGIQFARAASPFAFCDNWYINDLNTHGYFSQVGAYFYGQESTTYNKCQFWNSDPTGSAAYHLGVDVYPMSSDYLAPMTGNTSYINNKYINCDYRYLPTGNIVNITAITQANPAVVTGAGHPFIIGDTVVIGQQTGMAQIWNAKATITAVTANTFTLGALDSSGYAAYTSGGQAVKTATVPTVVFGRGSDQKFDACYIVNYGTDALEVEFGGQAYNDNCVFDFLFEGVGSRSAIRFNVGTSTKGMVGFSTSLYNIFTRDFVFSSNASGAGRVQLQDARVSISNFSNSQTPKIFHDEAMYQLYDIDLSIPNTTAAITPSSLNAFTGSLHSIADGSVVRYGSSFMGDVRRLVPSGGTTTTENYYNAAGTLVGYRLYNASTNVFSESTNGTEVIHHVPTALYPATDDTHNLGLNNRHWLWGYFSRLEKVLASLNFGYAAGVSAGGAVTQAGSKVTSVALNERCGRITTAADALAAGAEVIVPFSNSLITDPASNPFVVCNARIISPVDKYTVQVIGHATGSCSLLLKNRTGGSLSEAVIIAFDLLDLTTT